MNPISTGYKPEYGLGAVYQGINAADSEALNQEEIIKAYLANQREQQMQPLDVQTKQWDAASAQDKLNNPQYRKMALDGFIGQMQLQAAAGETAQLLAPFKRQTEQAQLGYDKGKLDVLRTIQDIDSKLRSGGGTDEQGNVVPFSPQDKATMEQLRQSHVADLANTPEFFQKQTLRNDINKSNEYIAQLKAHQTQKNKQDMTEKAFLNYQKAPPETRLAIAKMAIETQTNPFTKEPLTAQEMVGWQAMFKQDALTVDEKNNARGIGKTDVDKMTKGKVPTQPRSNVSGAGATTQTPALPAGWTLKN